MSLWRDLVRDVALNNLAVRYQFEARWADAEPLLERTLRARSGNENNFTNLIRVKFLLGKHDEARAVLRAGLAALPNNPTLHRGIAGFASADLRWAEADSLTRHSYDRFRDNPVARARPPSAISSTWRSCTAATVTCRPSRRSGSTR